MDGATNGRREHSPIRSPHNKTEDKTRQVIQSVTFRSKNIMFAKKSKTCKAINNDDRICSHKLRLFICFHGNIISLFFMIVHLAWHRLEWRCLQSQWERTKKEDNKNISRNKPNFRRFIKKMLTFVSTVM